MKNNQFVPTEYEEQCQAVGWLELKYPQVLYTATLGGVRVPIGLAVKLKKQGYKKGCPDILIFEQRNGQNGLFIEMKRQKGGIVSPEQGNWLMALEIRGYRAVVCRGLTEFMATVEDYLK